MLPEKLTVGDVKRIIDILNGKPADSTSNPTFNRTEPLTPKKENIDTKSQKKHKGKSAPFGSAYEPINENATYSNNINYKKYIKELTTHMLNQGMNLTPLPKVIFKNGDKENAENFFGKTAYYQPDTMEIVLYTEGRHPKDIVRSFAHEMIHHMQNLEGRLEGIATTNTQEDDHLTAIEAEAYQDGNLAFRGYTDTVLNEKKNKDPFGLNQFARELIQDNPQPIKEDIKSLAPQENDVIFSKNCGCDKT